jgi:hypothetical protein
MLFLDWKILFSTSCQNMPIILYCGIISTILFLVGIFMTAFGFAFLIGDLK